jgi:hypothetical protein
MLHYAWSMTLGTHGSVYAIQGFHNAWWCLHFNQNIYLQAVTHFQPTKSLCDILLSPYAVPG